MNFNIKKTFHSLAALSSLDVGYKLFILVLQSHIIRTFMNVKMSLMKEIMYTHTPKKVAELEKKSRFGNKFANSFNNVWIDLILAAYVLYIYFIYICNFFY